MRGITAFLSVVVSAAGCTHASISSIPMQVDGIGTVYRYQGRANFAHQMAEADRMIAEDCKARNGGKPIVVDLQKRDLGVIAFNSGQANTRIDATATRNPYSSNITGTAATTSSGSATVMRNYNQEIHYKCVTDGVPK